MRAVVYEAYGQLPCLQTVSAPRCAPGGVVVAVRATGVCRSDWHAWQGHDPVGLPAVPGHEFAGVVAEVADDVRTVRVGDRVTAPFVCGCGVCRWCLSGDAQVCPDQYQPGFTGPGSFADLVAVPAADVNIVRLPDSVGFTAAASLGCRFATAYRAVHAHGRLQAGQWLAVFGCGGVGLSAVLLAQAVGAHVVAVDVSPAALERAATLGAEVTVGGQDLVASVQRVIEVTDGGAHVGIDAIGSPLVAAASVRALRRRGRHVQVGLLLGDAAAATLPMDLVIAKELEIYGSHGMAAVDYPPMLALIESGALDPERLVGRVVGLDAAGAALAAMDDPRPSGLTVVTLPGA